MMISASPGGHHQWESAETCPVPNVTAKGAGSCMMQLLDDEEKGSGWHLEACELTCGMANA